jgi:hypothetical protein
MVIAAMADRVVDASQPIDLLNVAFETPKAEAYEYIQSGQHPLN